MYKKAKILLSSKSPNYILVIHNSVLDYKIKKIYSRRFERQYSE